MNRRGIQVLCCAALALLGFVVGLQMRPSDSGGAFNETPSEPSAPSGSPHAIPPLSATTRIGRMAKSAGSPTELWSELESLPLEQFPELLDRLSLVHSDWSFMVCAKWFDRDREALMAHLETVPSHLLHIRSSVSVLWGRIEPLAALDALQARPASIYKEMEIGTLLNDAIIREHPELDSMLDRLPKHMAYRRKVADFVKQARRDPLETIRNLPESLLGEFFHDIPMSIAIARGQAAEAAQAFDELGWQGAEMPEELVEAVARQDPAAAAHRKQQESRRQQAQREAMMRIIEVLESKGAGS